MSRQPGDIDLRPSPRFSNILATLDLSALVYYGRAGTLWVSTINSNSRIQVQAKTVNGNYGKTVPGMDVVLANTAAQGRQMVFQDLVQDSTYRTFLGVFNTSLSAAYSVQFTIFDANFTPLAAPFYKTMAPLSFLSFNPFIEAGVGTGVFNNCWVYINVMSGGSDVRGVICFGSIANNYTNDTYALIARMFN